MYTVKISGGCRESLYLKGTLSLFCSLIVCSLQEVSGLLSAEMTGHHPFQSYLAAISLETPSCSLLTNNGGRFQVFGPLLLPNHVSSSHLHVFIPLLISGAASSSLGSQPVPCQSPVSSWKPPNLITSLLRQSSQVEF